jgi:hypothetical protein
MLRAAAKIRLIRIMFNRSLNAPAWRTCLFASLIGVTAVVATGLGAPAYAACKWEWLCDGQGGCQHTPICEKLSDDPGAAPEQAAPKPPHALPPIESPRRNADVQCAHVQRQHAKSRKWVWDQVCFCAHPNADVHASQNKAHPAVLPGIKRCGVS